MELQDLRSRLYEVIEGDRHPDYGRTIEVAKFGRAMVTGKGQDDYIVQFKTRESDELKKQRINLYRSATQLACAPVRAMFRKVRRVDGITHEIRHSNPNSAELLTEKTNAFYLDHSVRDYVTREIEMLNFIDPNALLFIHWRDVANMEGVVQDVEFYPDTFLSEEILDVSKFNGFLQHVITFRAGEYFAYGRGGISIHAAEMQDDEVASDEYYTQEIIGKTYRFREFEGLPTDEIPALQCGAYVDVETNGRTFVTPLHFAEDLLHDLVRDKSYLDITKALHTFMQKYAYGPACQYDDHEGHACNMGYLTGYNEDVICPRCKGSGVNVHTTEQEAVILQMPATREEFIPLADLAHYVPLPEWLPRWQAEQVDKAVKSVFLSIFNKEHFDQAQVSDTATGKLLDWDQVYDTLEPYAAAISRAVTKAYTVIGDVLEVGDGLEVIFQFPKDYKMQSEAELIALRQAAQAAGASPDVLHSYDVQILSKRYQDNHDEMRRQLAFMQFQPFRDKTREEIVFILSARTETDPDRVLYENFTRVVREIRQETADEFHNFPPNVQADLIKEKVEELAAIIQYRAIRDLNTPFS